MLDNPNNIFTSSPPLSPNNLPVETSEVMSSLLFIWLPGFKLVWLTSGRCTIWSAKPAEIGNIDKQKMPSKRCKRYAICLSISLCNYLLPPKIIVTSFAGKISLSVYMEYLNTSFPLSSANTPQETVLPLSYLIIILQHVTRLALTNAINLPLLFWMLAFLYFSNLNPSHRLKVIDIHRL